MSSADLDSTPTPAARPVRIVARLPDAVRGLYAVERAVAASAVPKATRELVKIRASQLNGCAYCLDMHHLDAIALGETPTRLYLLAAWRETTVYTPEERAALALTEAITLISNGPVPADVEAEARTHYDDDAYAALVMAIVTINAWNRIAIASHSEPGHYTPGDHAR